MRKSLAYLLAGFIFCLLSLTTAYYGVQELQVVDDWDLVIASYGLAAISIWMFIHFQEEDEAEQERRRRSRRVIEIMKSKEKSKRL
jgi:uncharacterized protein (DUF1919 family)|tara:strand:+ start:1334 stop:1591 length:258 start_codon:yes stop_codon:yes gene_type:complete